MAQLIRFPDGKFYDVEGFSEKEIADAYRQGLEKFPQTVPETKPESKGIIGRGAELLGSGISELTGSTAEGIQTLIDPSATDTGLLGFAERRKESARDIAPIKPLQEAEGLGDVISSSLGYLTQSVPEMGTIMASAFAGAKAGAAVAPLHPLAKLIGGLGGATVGGIIPFLGRNTEEFKEVQGRNPTRAESGALLATASVQSALNSVISALAPFAKTTGADKVVGKRAGKFITELTTGSQNALQNALKKGVQGTVLEASTEASQDILQILAANEFDTDVLNDPENVFRVTEALLAGGAIGGGIGLISSPFNREGRTPEDNSELKENLNIIASRQQGLLPAPEKSDQKQIGFDATKKQKGSADAKSVLEREADVEDPEIKAIINDTKLSGKQKADAARKIFKSRAENNVINDILASSPGQGLSELAKTKRETFKDYNQKVEENIQEQINNTIRKDIILGRDDKGKETVSSMTVNELIQSASGDSDQVIQNILNSTIKNEVKAKQIADYYDRNALPKVRRMALGKKLLRKSAKKIDKDYNDWQATAEQKIAEQRADRIIDPATGEEILIETDTAAETVERTDPRDETILAPDKTEQQDIGGFGGKISDQYVAGSRDAKKVVNNIRDMDKRRGSRASVRTNEDGSINEEATAVAEQTYEGALKYVEERLAKLASRGRQGKLLAESLRMQVINPVVGKLPSDPSPLNGNQIAGAFLAAEEVVNILGEKGDVELKFLNTIAASKDTIAKSGGKDKDIAKGLATYGPDAKGKLRGLIELAYMDATGGFTPEQYAQTAAHESFHILQDTYAVADPKARSILRGAFDTERGYKKLPSAIKRLIRRTSPNAHDKLMKGDLQMSNTELQAFTFEMYKKAKQQGETDPLGGVLGNYFNFVTRFFPRFRNALQGAGFRSAEDILETAATGGMEQTFADTPTEKLREAARKDLKETSTTSDYILDFYNKEQPSYLDGEQPLTKDEVDQALEIIKTDEKYKGYSKDLNDSLTREMAKIIVMRDIRKVPNAARFGEDPLDTNGLSETNSGEQWNTVNQETSERASVRIVEAPTEIKKTPSYKLFRRLANGDLTTLFVEATEALGNENAPLTGNDANKFIGGNPDVFFFVPEFVAGYGKDGALPNKNTKGLKRVPTGKYDETGKKGRTTGDSTLIPNQKIRQELIDRGYLPKGSDATRIDTVAFRPGMHAAQFPEADHIAYNDDNVWAEVEIPNDTSVEIQKEVASFAPSERQLDRVPDGGYYTYKTNKQSNANNEWIIAGAMKIKRVLTDQEVNDIRKQNGLPRLEESKFYKKTKPYTKADNVILQGINVATDRKSNLEFADMIVDGEKKLETRDTNSLKPYINKRMSIVRTEKGTKAKAIGSAIIGEPREVDVDEFRSLEDKHKVPAGSEFDIKQGKTKFVYPIIDPIRYDGERAVAGDGRVSRKVSPERASVRIDKVDERLEELNDPEKFPTNPEFDEMVGLFGLSPEERKLTGIDLLFPPREVFTPTNKQDEKLSVKESGKIFQKQAEKIYNGDRIVNTPSKRPTAEQNESLSRMFAALAFAVNMKSKNSAIDWYTKSIDAAIQAVGKVHPEVLDPSKPDRAALSMAIAVTSQGMEVERNAKIGLAVYEEWKTTGQFPEFGEGKSTQAMQKNFRVANLVNNKLRDTNQTITDRDGNTRPANFWDFMNAEFTVGDLKKFFIAEGFTTTDGQAKKAKKKYKKGDIIPKNKKVGDLITKADIGLTGELTGSTVYGSFLLGPKIGQGFFQNLMGNFKPITMDMWFMRTWGRMTGTLVGKEPSNRSRKYEKGMYIAEGYKVGDRMPPFEEKKLEIVEEIKKLQSNKETIENVNPEDVQFIRSIDTDMFTDPDREQETFDTIREIEAINQRWYDVSSELEGFDSDQRPQLFRSNANAIINGLATIDSPRNGTDRQWMRSTIDRSLELLSEQGLNLTSADFQALIWYPEKDLFRLMGEGTPEQLRNISYKEAYEGVIKDGKDYKSIRRKKGGVFSVSDAGGGESVGSTTKGKGGRSSGSDSEADVERASVRIQDSDLSDVSRRILESPVDAQGLLPKDLQGFKFQVLKYLAPFNIFNKRVREKFVDEFVNGLEPLARRERAVRKKLIEKFPDKVDEINKLPGSLLSYEEGAFKAVEMAQQMAGRVEMMAEKGAPVLQSDGSVLIDPNTKGLFEIFRPIGQSKDYVRFQTYVYAKRSQRLLSEGREALMTEADIREGLSYENDTFKKVFADYEVFNKAMMKFMVDTGSITQDQADKLTSTHDYIPFYRIQEEEVYEGGLFGQIKKPKRGVLGTTTAFDKPDLYIKNVMKELKGGEQKIGDLYTNVFANAQSILSAGMKNVAMQKTVKMIEQAKQLGLYEDVPKKPSFITKAESKNNENHFTYRENGETKFYDVGDDQDLLTALRTFTPIQMQGILKFMQNISRMFRSLITITPGFMIANFLRGDMAGVVTVDAKLVPVIDSIKGLRNVFNDSETALEMKTIGGFGGYTFGEGAVNFSNKMKKFYRRHEGYDIVDSPQRVSDMISTLLDKVNSVGETTELATREAIYRKLTEAKVSKADAAYEALNLINFNRRGNPQGAAAQTLGILLPLVPFLNARIQGLYRTGTALGGTESNYKATALKGMTLMGMSLGLYAIMSQDEDWEKEPLYRKLNYYIIYAGDKKFLIPKPFEVGAIFSTIPEVFLDGIRQRDGEYVKDAVVQLFLNNFEFNPIPQAISPLLEVATNKDFFRGRELESLGQRGLPTAQRAYSTTSQFAQLMGEATATMGISPIEFEQLVNGYLGSMGSLVLAGMDSLLGMTGAVPKKPTGLFGDNVFSKAADSIGLTRFYKQKGMADPANRYLSQFYELKREADQLLRGINNMREQGNYEDAIETRKQNRSLLGARSTLNKMFNQINDINDKIQGVRTRDIDPNKKAEQIRQLLTRRNLIANRVKQIKERIRKAA